jgi:hypothetical protein
MGGSVCCYCGAAWRARGTIVVGACNSVVMMRDVTASIRDGQNGNPGSGPLSR